MIFSCAIVTFSDDGIFFWFLAKAEGWSERWWRKDLGKAERRRLGRGVVDEGLSGFLIISLFISVAISFHP